LVSSSPIPPFASSSLDDVREILPAAVDLTALRDRRVRITRSDDLFAVSEGRHLWLMVGINRVSGVHRVGGLEIRVAASNRPGGPLAIGTPEAQCLLRVGESITLGDHVFYVVSRGDGGATYAIVDRALWRGSQEVGGRR
jgi:hypothetical protein